MRTKTFIWSILTICLVSPNMFAQHAFSESEMMGVKFTVYENLLICENLENTSKTLSITEAEVTQSRYATINYKCILKEKEIKYFDLYLKNSKVDVSITEYYAVDGNGNLKGITLDWSLREPKNDQQ